MQVASYKHCLGVNIMDIRTSPLITTLLSRSALLCEMRTTALFPTSPLFTFYISSHWLLSRSVSHHTHPFLPWLHPRLMGTRFYSEFFFASRTNRERGRPMIWWVLWSIVIGQGTGLDSDFVYAWASPKQLSKMPVPTPTCTKSNMGGQLEAWESDSWSTWHDFDASDRWLRLWETLV